MENFEKPKQPSQEDIAKIEKDKESTEDNESSGLDKRWNELGDFVSSKLERKKDITEKDNKEVNKLDIEDLEKFNLRLSESFDNLKIDQEILSGKTDVSKEEYKEAVLDLYRIQTELGDLTEEYGIESKNFLLNAVEKIYLEKTSLLVQEEINSVLQGQELEVKGTLKDFLKEQRKHQAQGYSLISKRVRDRIEKATSELLKGTIETLKKVSPGERVQEFLENIDTKKISGKIAIGSSAILLGSLSLYAVFNPEIAEAEEEEFEQKFTELDEEVARIKNEIEVIITRVERYSETREKTHILEGVAKTHYNIQEGTIEVSKGNLVLTFNSLEKFGKTLTDEEITNEHFEKFIEKAEMRRDYNRNIEDETKFNNFIKDRAEAIIQEENFSALDKLTPREWMFVTSKIVQDNITYEYEALTSNMGEIIDGKERTKMDIFRENIKLDSMPLDEVLIEHKKGVCRQYSALTEEVGERLKEVSNSDFLKNVYVDEVGGLIAGNMRHAWNIVYEVKSVENTDKVAVDMYFIDNTADDKVGEEEGDVLGSQIDAYNGHINLKQFLIDRSAEESPGYIKDKGIEKAKGATFKPANAIFSEKEVLDICNVIIDNAEKNDYETHIAETMSAVLLLKEYYNYNEAKEEIKATEGGYPASPSYELYVLQERIKPFINVFIKETKKENTPFIVGDLTENDKKMVKIEADLNHLSKQLEDTEGEKERQKITDKIQKTIEVGKIFIEEEKQKIVKEKKALNITDESPIINNTKDEELQTVEKEKSEFSDWTLGNIKNKMLELQNLRYERTLTLEETNQRTNLGTVLQEKLTNEFSEEQMNERLYKIQEEKNSLIKDIGDSFNDQRWDKVAILGFEEKALNKIKEIK